MPASQIATVLAGLTAAVAALLLFVLCWRAQARAGTWRAVAGRSRRPLRWLMTSALLLAGAELLLPPERLETHVHHLQAISGGAVELTYGVCCTGGGMDACVVPAGTALRPGQAVELRRTRLLGRCSAQVMDGPPAPCRCS